MVKYPEKDRGDLVLNVKVGRRLQRIARMIEKELGKAGADREQVQFSLLVWGPGRSQYVSNARREDVKTALVELIERWDTEADLGQPKMPLGGEYDA